jgi:transcriptional regulator with XRE-family HTH domain
MRRRRTDRASLYRRSSYRELTRRLAANVRRMRLANGWTQEQAAEYCEIGSRMYQTIEAGDTNVTLVTLARLADGFDVESGELLLRVRRQRRAP